MQMIRTSTSAAVVRPARCGALAMFGVLTVAAMLPVNPARASETTSRLNMAPDALIQSASSEILDTIRADPALRRGDVERLQKLIDEEIAPYLDFERMTRLSVGHNWRSATADQRQVLMREFRTLLIRTYSGALSHVTDHQVRMRAFRAQPGDTDVIVRTEVVPSAGEPVQLDYRLEKTDNGWKVFDVIIMGVSLVENFRNSFASEINQNGVDGVIKALRDHNKQLATSSGSKI